MYKTLENVYTKTDLSENRKNETYTNYPLSKFGMSWLRRSIHNTYIIYILDGDEYNILKDV